MRIITVLGTRPEIIRLSRIIPRLDAISEHILVFTGQNFSSELSTIFFKQLGIRKPDYNFEILVNSTWEQIGQILSKTDKILEELSPDRFLILGDTNSALTAQCAKRRGIPVYHMEAGNRCFDDRVPEEINRRVIDHSSDVLLPYTNRSRDNLLREGFHPSRILVTGNPIFEVINHYSEMINQSKICEKLKITPNNYFLVTLHRAENVDIPERLNSFFKSFYDIQQQYNLPVVISLHPRTKNRLNTLKISIPEKVYLIEPPGFFDFIFLEKNAKAVLSDSGTVQEEGCILEVPTVTLRDVTERPETIECGSNILTGCKSEDIIRCLEVVLSMEGNWNKPLEYMETQVSRTVCNILLGFKG